MSVPLHLIKTHSTRVKWVVLISLVTMFVELGAGALSNSMALLADGWHMASHVGALGTCMVAYWLVERFASHKAFRSGTGKILHLSGYLNAFALGIVAVLMAIHSIKNLLLGEPILYTHAIPIAMIGLLVNLVSAAILHRPHQGHHHHKDHNLKAAYIHVLSDALTSVLAIVGLGIGYVSGIDWIDPLLGILGSIVILKWALELGLDSAKALLDYSSDPH